MARRVQHFEMPRPAVGGTRPQVEPVAVVQKPIDATRALQLLGRQRMGPDRHAIALRTDRGGADVVGMMVRQDDGGERLAGARLLIEHIEKPLLLLGVVGAGIDQVARAVADEEGIGVRARRQGDAS